MPRDSQLEQESALRNAATRTTSRVQGLEPPNIASATSGKDAFERECRLQVRIESGRSSSLALGYVMRCGYAKALLSPSVCC